MLLPYRSQAKPTDNPLNFPWVTPHQDFFICQFLVRRLGLQLCYIDLLNSLVCLRVGWAALVLSAVVYCMLAEKSLAKVW